MQQISVGKSANTQNHHQWQLAAAGSCVCPIVIATLKDAELNGCTQNLANVAQNTK